MNAGSRDVYFWIDNEDEKGGQRLGRGFGDDSEKNKIN